MFWRLFVFGFLGVTASAIADQSGMSSYISKLQNASSLSIRCSIKHGSDSAEIQVVHLKKPNFFKITTGGASIVANGQYIISTDDLGKLRSKVKQTNESLREVLLAPKYRIWLPFFDANAFSDSIVSKTSDELRQGKLYYTVQAEWQKPTSGGVKITLDSQSHTPKDASIFSGTDVEATRLLFSEFKVNETLNNEAFSLGDFATSANEANTGDAFERSWSKFLDYKGTHLMPALGKFKFTGNLEQTKTDLRTKYPWVSLTLFADGVFQSETKFGDKTIDWAMTLDSSKLTEGLHEVSIKAKYQDSSFQDASKEIGKASFRLASKVIVKFGSLKQSLDGTFLGSITELPEAEGVVVVSVGGKEPRRVPAKSSISFEIPGVLPGNRTCVGTFETEEGFAFPFDSQQVEVMPAYSAKLAVEGEIKVTPQNAGEVLVINLGIDSGQTINQVDVFNLTTPLGTASYANGKIQIPNGSLASGENDLVFRHKLSDGKSIILGRVLIRATIDVQVQRDNIVRIVSLLTLPRVKAVVAAYCCAANLQPLPENITDAFVPIVKPIPSENEWAKALDWTLFKTELGSLQPPITTDEVFNEEWVGAYQAATDFVIFVNRAIGYMSFSYGEDGIIKRSQRATISNNLSRMAAAVNEADDAAKLGLRHLTKIQSFVAKHSGSNAKEFSVNLGMMKKVINLWDDHQDQVNYIRVLAKIFDAFPDELALQLIVKSMPQGSTTTWHSKVRDAISSLILAIQDLRRIEELRQQSDNKNAGKQIDQLKKEIAKLQAAAWTSIIREGRDLGINLIGIEQSIPVIIPN